MKNLTILSILLLITAVWACTPKPTSNEVKSKEETTSSLKGRKYKDPRESDEGMKEAYALQEKIKNRITADFETKAVEVSTIDEDAADDPAVWVNPEDASKSLIIGTHKKRGLYVYNLEGEELGFYPVGKVNNVDIRQGVVLGNDTLDIVAASNRTDNTITLMKIEDGKLIDIAARPLKVTPSIQKAYGFCLYKSNEGKAYAFINGKNGVIQQWELKATDSTKVDAIMVRSMKVPSQPEGMVADDVNGILYVGEEAQGIWKVSANPQVSPDLELIESTTIANNEYLTADIEGISLYKTSDTTGYLLASSQGNFSYAVFSLEGEHEYITSFAIVDGVVDGVEETDGIETINVSLGEKFPKGALIVQDGFNFENDSIQAQNFKVVNWEKIEALLEAKEL
ncbi:phytase [Sediminitomix flava]|nr:phytase [Sediminitomix flava]